MNSKPRVNFKPYRHTTAYYKKVKNILHLYNEKALNKASNSSLTTPSIRPFEINATQNHEHLVAAQSHQEGEDRSQNFAEEGNFDADEEEMEDTEREIEEAEVVVDLMNELRDWALTYKVSHVATTALPKILNGHEGMSHMPINSRTLLGSPRTVDIIEMGSGHYWYHGIKNSLAVFAQDCVLLEQFDTLSLIFNMDGIAPFKSSPKDLWPILFTIAEIPNFRPLAAAIYYGHGKPPLQDYLKPFVAELCDILQNGLRIGSRQFCIKTKFFVCDSPARSFIKGVVYFNAEHGCIKCNVLGEWDHEGHHMSFPRTDCPRRTDQQFRLKSDEDHHKETTPLEDLPINMVEDIIVSDSLHLFDLGNEKDMQIYSIHNTHNTQFQLLYTKDI